MTSDTTSLPLGVYPVTTLPGKAAANNKGDVLWFCPQHGWYKGSFQWVGHFTGTTHWTSIPDEPEAPSPVDVKAERDAAFKRWLDQFPTQLDPAAVALMRSGFDGGYTYRGQP
jgi:hypothetical protein